MLVEGLFLLSVVSIKAKIIVKGISRNGTTTAKKTIYKARKPMRHGCDC